VCIKPMRRPRLSSDLEEKKRGSRETWIGLDQSRINQHGKLCASEQADNSDNARHQPQVRITWHSPVSSLKRSDSAGGGIRRNKFLAQEGNSRRKRGRRSRAAPAPAAQVAQTTPMVVSRQPVANWLLHPGVGMSHCAPPAAAST
jgi:hypothetical protein